MAHQIEKAVQLALDKGVKMPDLGGGCGTKKVTMAVTGHLGEMGGD